MYGYPTMFNIADVLISKKDPIWESTFVVFPPLGGHWNSLFLPLWSSEGGERGGVVSSVFLAWYVYEIGETLSPFPKASRERVFFHSDAWFGWQHRHRGFHTWWMGLGAKNVGCACYVPGLATLRCRKPLKWVQLLYFSLTFCKLFCTRSAGTRSFELILHWNMSGKWQLSAMFKWEEVLRGEWHVISLFLCLKIEMGANFQIPQDPSAIAYSFFFARDSAYFFNSNPLDNSFLCSCIQFSR